MNQLQATRSPAIERSHAERVVREQLADDVRQGLTARKKSLPTKYLYDAHGSELFEEITRVEEYYPTRAETQILEKHADAILKALRPEELVEIGSGYSRKTTLLLDAMHAHGASRYVPMDVSESAVRAAAATLHARYPWLEVDGVVGDYDHEFPQLTPGRRRLVAFLGSTIGNFHTQGRVTFLKRVRKLLEKGDRLLIGMDLVKDIARLEAAYNDKRGITAAFTKNVLNVINRELSANFPLADFEHKARYEPKKQRMEMSLRARRALRVHIDALELDVDFEAGEEILAEISCKFTRPVAEKMLAEVGLKIESWLTDAAGDFALVLAAPV